MKTDDNRYHHQALRHLYVLAAEPRALIPYDLEAKKLAFVDVSVEFQALNVCGEIENYTIQAPCILPELSQLRSLKVDDVRYWDVSFNLMDPTELKRFSLILTKQDGIFAVRRKTGCMLREDDPTGSKWVAIPSLTSMDSEDDAIQSIWNPVTNSAQLESIAERNLVPADWKVSACFHFFLLLLLVQFSPIELKFNSG